MKRGVPVGYKHSWRYRGRWKERKVKPGVWEFEFVATKDRAGSPKGGLAIGKKVAWDIRARQTAKKVGGRTYQTKMRGTKRLVKVT